MVATSNTANQMIANATETYTQYKIFDKKRSILELVFAKKSDTAVEMSALLVEIFDDKSAKVVEIEAICKLVFE